VQGGGGLQSFDGKGEPSAAGGAPPGDALACMDSVPSTHDDGLNSGGGLDTSFLGADRLHRAQAPLLAWTAAQARRMTASQWRRA
jgi:hypothetical protein